MGWMAKALNFVCGIAGYSSCSSLSTFEAIVLGGLTLGVLYFVIGFIVYLIPASIGR